MMIDSVRKPRRHYVNDIKYLLMRPFGVSDNDELMIAPLNKLWNLNIL